MEVPPNHLKLHRFSFSIKTTHFRKSPYAFSTALPFLNFTSFQVGGVQEDETGASGQFHIVNWERHHY
jgi:hypothetical protein